jgi:hypothetical protein
MDRGVGSRFPVRRLVQTRWGTRTSGESRPPRRREEPNSPEARLLALSQFQVIVQLRPNAVSSGLWFEGIGARGL